jgi:hypothetical protein
VRKLTEDEYKATMGTRRVGLGPDEEPPFDFWPYFDAIPPEDFGGHDFSEGDVPHVWTMPDTPYQHVLVQCEATNVFLVLVLDLHERAVAGHHLLDLNEVYGLA